MTNSFKLNQITKVGSGTLPVVQKLLLQIGFSLGEVWEHDNGDTHEVWLQAKNGQQIVLDIINEADHCDSNIVSEIIDCWFELRAIRDLLTADEPELIKTENSLTAHDKFLEKVQEQKVELADAMSVLPMIFGKEPDLELLSFFDLDESTREALLQ